MCREGAHVWRLENTWESVVSFCHLNSEEGIQIVRLGGECPQPQSHLTGMPGANCTVRKSGKNENFIVKKKVPQIKINI